MTDSTKTKHASTADSKKITTFDRIRAIVAKLPQLGHVDRGVLLVLLDCANFETGEAFPGMDLLLKKTGSGSNNVRAALKRLEHEHGLIETVRAGGGRGRATVYQLLAPETLPTTGRVLATETLPTVNVNPPHGDTETLPTVNINPPHRDPPNTSVNTEVNTQEHPETGVPASLGVNDKPTSTSGEEDVLDELREYLSNRNAVKLLASQGAVWCRKLLQEASLKDVPERFVRWASTKPDEVRLGGKKAKKNTPLVEEDAPREDRSPRHAGSTSAAPAEKLTDWRRFKIAQREKEAAREAALEEGVVLDMPTSPKKRTA